MSVVEVPLRDRYGRSRGAALIDAEDAEAVLAYRWSVNGRGYVHRNFRLPDGRQRTLLLHRVLLGLEHGDPREGDHENRNRLDCRRSNLRIVTHAQNMQNLRPSGNGGTSPHRGVSWDRTRGKWRAVVRLASRKRTIGRFDTEQEAVAAVVAFRAAHMPFSSDAASGWSATKGESG